MLDFLKKNKTLTAVVVLVVFVLLYFVLYSTTTPNVSSSDTESPASQQLLVTLANLHTIKLDGSIFSDPVFVSLSDFGVTIPPENAGRRNPFAPVINAAPQQSSVTVPSVNQTTTTKSPAH
jgi:hypothetical protein